MFLLILLKNQLPKILPAFLKKYPEIRLQLMVSNRRVDVINEGIDIALRVRSKLDDDPSLVLRQFALIEQSLFASQAYLNEFGDIKNPEQLSEHRILSLSEEHLDQQFLLHGPDNQQKENQSQPYRNGYKYPYVGAISESKLWDRFITRERSRRFSKIWTACTNFTGMESSSRYITCCISITPRVITCCTSIY